MHIPSGNLYPPDIVKLKQWVDADALHKNFSCCSTTTSRYVTYIYITWCYVRRFFFELMLCCKSFGFSLTTISSYLLYILYIYIYCFLVRHKSFFAFSSPCIVMCMCICMCLTGCYRMILALALLPHLHVPW
jgi:hypothetical protein